MSHIVVVGAGVGGLAAATRLAVAGHEVTVFDSRDRAGGKLDSATVDGFTFETGPSLLTLPGVFAELFAVAGESLAEHVEMVRLDPVCRHRFSDGSGFDTRNDAADTEAEIDAMEPGAGSAWRRFHEHGRKVWEVAERTFFAGPMAGPWSLLRRIQHPGDLFAIDGLTTLDNRARSFFDDPRLVQFVDRYATYSGSSPFRAPATLSCIPAIEQLEGAWYVTGGLGALRDAVVELAVGVGVDIRLQTPVERILTADDTVTGVELADGEIVDAVAVVANVDSRVLARDLLDDASLTRHQDRLDPSSSAHVLLLGVKGSTEGLAHHNVWFSENYEAEFAALFGRGEPASDPTVYVACSSITDPGQAPAGHENWFVLTNAPPGAGEMHGYGDHVLETMARRGHDLSGRIVLREEFGPAEIEKRFNSPGGSIYGTASNSRRAAFVRPGNIGPRDGLFLAGGSSHPGGGLPLVAISGGIAADLVDRHVRGRRL